MFDSHVHIFDPRFPLIENNGVTPDYFTVDDYRRETAGIDVHGGAIISSSFQTGDQKFLTTLLEELGSEWVGVTQLDANSSDKEIRRLNEAGVRGLRFNLRRGKIDIAELTLLARRAHDLVGWHTEMYVDGKMLSSLEPVIAKLPALSIDHLGMSDGALPYLLDLVDRGAKVKASGFGRVEIADVVDSLRQVHRANPQALMFGTDLPSVRADRSFDHTDLDLVADAVGDDLQLVLEDNAREFYRLPPRKRPKAPVPAKTKPMPIIELSEVDVESGDSGRSIKKKIKKAKKLLAVNDEQPDTTEE